MKKRIALWAHGTKNPAIGFSGGQGLLAYFQEYEKTIDAEIVVVISPFENGSAASKTNAFNEARHSSISHITFSTYTTEEYQRITKTYAIDLHFFSGWLKLVKGLDPLTAINIHPGPIQMVRDISGNTWHFGGKGLRGDHLHRKVREAYQAGVIRTSAISMHYITDQFDDARYLIGQVEVPILQTDRTREEYKQRARNIEPAFQQYVCAQLANGAIRIEYNQVVIDNDVEFPGAIFGKCIALQR